MYFYFLSFNWQIIFNCLTIIYFVPLQLDGHLGCLHPCLLWGMFLWQDFVWTYALESHRYLWSRLARSYGNFNFLSNCWTMIVAFFILATEVGMMWYLVVLVGISLTLMVLSSAQLSSTHSLGNVCSNPSSGFRIELSVLSCAHCCRYCSSTQNMNLLLGMWSTNVFSHSVVAFLFGQCPLKHKSSLILIKSTLFIMA